MRQIIDEMKKKLKKFKSDIEITPEDQRLMSVDQALLWNGLMLKMYELEFNIAMKEHELQKENEK